MKRKMEGIYMLKSEGACGRGKGRWKDRIQAFGYWVLNIQEGERLVFDRRNWSNVVRRM